MTAQTSSVFTLSDNPSSRSSTLLSISIKSEEEETGETDPKLLDLSLTRSHDDEPEQEQEELRAFELNETRLILLGLDIVQVSLDLDGQLRTHPCRQDIIVTILHLQLQLHHHPLPDHFILLDSEFELNCCKSLDPSFQQDPSEQQLLIILLLPSTDQQSWAVMRSRWAWSLDGRPIEGREKKWRFVLGAPLKPSLV
ncbi:BZ3500_MvSof-1268-A1-R1_Chr3-1g06065 [Microbotryum saponariae]|uniref:BZ3500_MvSof-1268-A1-R1_Chr3-1g06065 protein n=1 Tax=Microbotryum saponariae TaxID=289078 RepID=A0A2X0N2R5_9BASI|nr:BZ3500_MvSof-1268-A1-R1_Chr3-1g06065 [Microbotryum saponariae]SDA03896.1 BZ3501_MvSof-1269-A2-R1_Chr3-2g05750 [Microbotryum saponariae]